MVLQLELLRVQQFWTHPENGSSRPMGHNRYLRVNRGFGGHRGRGNIGCNARCHVDNGRESKIREAGAMVIFDQDISLFARVSGQSGRIWTKSTDPLQVSVDEVEVMKVLQPMGDIYQLWEPVSCRSTRESMVTHELDPVYFWVLLDEVVDVTVTHPFRNQRKLIWFQCRAEQR